MCLYQTFIAYLRETTKFFTLATRFLPSKTRVGSLLAAVGNHPCAGGPHPIGFMQVGHNPNHNQRPIQTFNKTIQSNTEFECKCYPNTFNTSTIAKRKQMKIEYVYGA